MIQSPIIRGGLKVIAAALVLVALFAGGLAVGEFFFDQGKADRTTLQGLAEGGPDRPIDSSGEPTDGADAPGSSERVPALVPGDTGGQAPTTPQEGADPADGEPDISDAAEAKKPPGRDAEPSPPSVRNFLAEKFGVQAAPPRVAGMARTEPPVTSGSVIEAVYSGGGDGGFDLLFLTVERTESPAAARKRADELIHMFPVGTISFDWGGRQVRQAMNDEGRPEQFPPLVCMVWTSDVFAIRVVTAPIAPYRVADARQGTLEFIGGLPY